MDQSVSYNLLYKVILIMTCWCQSEKNVIILQTWKYCLKNLLEFKFKNILYKGILTKFEPSN